MLVSLDSNNCIGCGVCVQIAPDVFSLDSSRGIAKVISEEGNESVEQAVKSCPVSCIKIQ